ncbi:MAG: hypothetical protein QXX08_05780 [Candidatus Bathyarchaeia archaeon]
MDIESYFGMILSILIGLTFITLVFIFLYIVYGEKEEGTSTSKIEYFKNTLESIINRVFNLCFFLR